MEDSKYALFVEPNAYINNLQNPKSKITKVVFSEPYDCMPNFRINNDFKKPNCDCVKPYKSSQNYNKKQGGFNCVNNQTDLRAKQSKTVYFDFKTFLPLLAKLNMGGNSNVNNITNLLSSFGDEVDFNKLISNPELIQTVLKMFNKPKNSTPKEEIVCTDYEIKKYTKV